jgi:hypothetical protein
MLEEADCWTVEEAVAPVNVVPRNKRLLTAERQREKNEDTGDEETRRCLSNIPSSTGWRRITNVLSRGSLPARIRGHDGHRATVVSRTDYT